MATFPPYARLLFDGASESFDPGIVKSEMERGLAKQRVQSRRVLRKLNATVMFKSAEDATAFETWYFTTIGRIGFFDVVHPRTRAVVPMRFENADIGELVPLMGRFEVAKRSFVLEYLQ